MSNSVFYVDNTQNSIAGYSHNFDNFGITLGQTNEGGLFYLGQNPEGLNAIKLEGGKRIINSKPSSSLE